MIGICDNADENTLPFCALLASSRGIFNNLGEASKFNPLILDYCNNALRRPFISWTPLFKEIMSLWCSRFKTSISCLFKAVGMTSLSKQHIFPNFSFSNIAWKASIVASLEFWVNSWSYDYKKKMKSTKYVNLYS